MTTGIAQRLIVIVNPAWCFRGDGNAKRLHEKHQLNISDRRSAILSAASDVTVKFRNRSGGLEIDNDARLIVSDNPKRVQLRSIPLTVDFEARPLDQTLLLAHLEQIDEILRVTVCYVAAADFGKLSHDRPELRLEAFDIPPATVVEIEPSRTRDGHDADGMYEVLLRTVIDSDKELFAVHTDRFLSAPHIVVPLLSHLASLSAEDNLKFPVQLKKIADQFRALLTNPRSKLHISKVARSHLDTWADAQGKRYAFVDGGVSKIAGLPGTEPTAMRVGIYCVRPGDANLKTRESWQLHPFVVGDLIDRDTGVPMSEDEQIDLRRLGEATRYIVEPLSTIRFAEKHPDVELIFMHGPLINQFVQYDEGPPHFLPYLRRSFLESAGISESMIEHDVGEIPKGRDGKPMWRQFMAVYGHIVARLFNSGTPIVGVVERSAGSWLAGAVLNAAVESGIVLASYKRKVEAVLKRYNISDDLLFGCVLAEGEYVAPVEIPKNVPRRARENWQSVVGRYARPFATVLKTAEVTFPFRVELNREAAGRETEVMRFLYHTARLLPRYAFPVGLDIVDKYAKVPTWLSKNISARLASNVLNRAMGEGDPRLLAQIRQLLAHTPRDFFYRPQT